MVTIICPNMPGGSDNIETRKKFLTTTEVLLQ